MAGTHHTGKGGAGNHQCMPQEPEYNLWYNTTSYTIISGAEYRESPLSLMALQMRMSLAPDATAKTLLS